MAQGLSRKHTGSAEAVPTTFFCNFPVTVPSVRTSQHAAPSFLPLLLLLSSSSSPAPLPLLLLLFLLLSLGTAHKAPVLFLGLQLLVVMHQRFVSDIGIATPACLCVQGHCGSIKILAHLPASNCSMCSPNWAPHTQSGAVVG